MGKAAQRERAKRVHYLKRLAETQRDRFTMEWEKRVTSWLYLIHKNAGKFSDFSDEEGIRFSQIFSLVDEAMSILEACGPDKFSEYAEKTYKLLCNECCRAFSAEVIPQLVRRSKRSQLVWKP